MTRWQSVGTNMASNLVHLKSSLHIGAEDLNHQFRHRAHERQYEEGMCHVRIDRGTM